MGSENSQNCVSSVTRPKSSISNKNPTPSMILTFANLREEEVAIFGAYVEIIPGGVLEVEVK